MPPPLQVVTDLNSRPELSEWRSPRMSAMRLIVLHQYTKFEVRRPSRSEDMADFPSRRVNRLGDTLTFDLSTSKWDRSPVS